MSFYRQYLTYFPPFCDLPNIHACIGIHRVTSARHVAARGTLTDLLADGPCKVEHADVTPLVDTNCRPSLCCIGQSSL